MEIAERPRITKLLGPNFRNWSKQLRLTLKDRRVWSAIDPEYEFDDDVNAPAKEESEELAQARKEQVADRRNVRACTIIMESYVQSIVNKIIRFETAKEIWDYLRRTYAQDGLQQLIAKKEAFNSYSPSTTSSVSDIAAALDDFQDEIAQINPTVQTNQEEPLSGSNLSSQRETPHRL
jgi:hypothetical protein